MSKIVSQEMLNAYLDNELDENDMQFIDFQIKNSTELQNRVKKLQDLKLKIKSSYASISPPDHPKSSSEKNKHIFPAAIAASLILLVGLTSGWYSHSFFNSFFVHSDSLLGVKLDNLKPEDNKIIIHLAKNDVALFDQALTKAEQLLTRFDTLNQDGKIHVMANSYGMDLLRKDKTPYQERIINIMKNNDNIQFVACENTIKRLQSTGKPINLLPGVKVHGPVINEIIAGLQSGWTYMKI